MNYIFNLFLISLIIMTILFSILIIVYPPKNI